MSTASFNRTFEIVDPESALQLHEDLQNPRKIEVVKRDYAAEEKEGIELLKQRLARSQSG